MIEGVRQREMYVLYLDESIDVIYRQTSTCLICDDKTLSCVYSVLCVQATCTVHSLYNLQAMYIQSTSYVQCVYDV